jgi:hypothetical protein
VPCPYFPCAAVFVELPYRSRFGGSLFSGGRYITRREHKMFSAAEGQKHPRLPLAP